MNKISNEVNKTIDSREVAEMMEVEHKYILRSIEGTDKVVGIIPTLLSANLHPDNYFIKSSYKDNSGKTNKCYQITKMGCEMLGNKQQGEKGILFTARYVKRFNDMENYIEDKVPMLSTEEILELQYKYTKEVKEEVKELKEDFNDFRDNAPLFNIECDELMDKVKSVATRELGGYKSPAYKDKSLRSKVYSDIQHQLRREFGVKKYKAIKRNQLNKAIEIVDNYKAPTVLVNEIVQAVLRK